MYAQCKTMALSRNHCTATMHSVRIVELHNLNSIQTMTVAEMLSWRIYKVPDTFFPILKNFGVPPQVFVKVSNYRILRKSVQWEPR